MKQLVTIFLLIALNASGQSLIQRFTDLYFTSSDDFYPVGDLIFFTASTSEHGRELWRTDGTTSGTKLVADINLGEASSNPDYFNNINGTLFFRTYDGLQHSMWKSDGETASLVNIKEGAWNFVPLEIIQLNNKLYFISHSKEIFRSNETSDGSFQLEKINAIGVYNEFVVCNGMIFFASNHPSLGVDLWKTDGTAEGTDLVKDFEDDEDYGNYPYNSTAFFDLIVFDNSVFFLANDGIHGKELWKTDGTNEGTVLVKDIFDGANGSEPKDFIIVDNKLFFVASHLSYGRELWVTDGTENGTKLVKDVNPGVASSLSYYQYENMVGTSSNLYFYVNYPTGNSNIWKSDGTTSGTQIVSEFYVPLGLAGSSASKNAIYATSGNVWRIDDCGVYPVDTLALMPTYGETALVGRSLIFWEHRDDGRRLYAYDTQNDPTIPLEKPVLSIQEGSELLLQEQSQLVLVSNVSIGNTWYKDTVLIEGETSNSLVINTRYSGSYSVKTILGNCSSEVSDPLIYTDVTENSNDDAFEVFPNPTNGTLHLKNPSSLQSEVNVLNIYGDIVYQGLINEIAELNIDKVASGMYLVKIIYPGHGTVTKKIIKR